MIWVTYGLQNVCEIDGNNRLSIPVSVLFSILAKNGFEGTPYVVPPAIYLLLALCPNHPQFSVLPTSLCYRKKYLFWVSLSFFVYMLCQFS